MRAHTIGSFRFAMMIAIGLGVTSVASQARAGDVDTGEPSATAGGPNSSVGSAALKYEQTTGLPTSIETGFKTVEVLKVKVGVNVGVRIDPVTNGGPLFTVDMPKGALIEASWGTDKKILLKPQIGTQTDGMVTVRHTLSPSIGFMFNGLGLNATFNYGAADLINKIPGAKFNYDSRAQQAFAPWGFAQVDTVLNAPDMANATLFSLEMKKLPSFVSNKIDGDFGIRASTKPTFSYKTTKIMLTGVNGQITTPTEDLSIDAIDGDFLELMAAVEGEMTVAGSIGIQPYIHLTRLMSLTMDTPLGIDVFQMKYTVPNTPVAFQSAVVHIAMPNVHAPTKGIDLGEVNVGGTASKTVEIENTGEKEAVVSFTSSESAFKVTSESVTIAPKSTYELIVKYSPDSADPQLSEISVNSSDPDSPVQTFKIGANGADVGEEEDGTKNGPKSEDGCGCKAAGASQNLPSWAGFGLLGLGALVLVRRRKSA